MAIEPVTGLITWPNPSRTAHGIVVTVEDALGSSDSQAYSIAVGTDGWLFVDADRGDDAAGDGTISGPFRTIEGLFENDYRNARTYFRAGVYKLDGLPARSSGTDAQRVELEYDGSSGRGHSTVWIAYPGEVPAIDLQYSGDPATYASFIRFYGPSIFVDGFECFRDKVKCFEFSHVAGHGSYCSNVRFHSGGPGADGSNAAFIMTTASYGTPAYGAVFKNNFYGDCGHNAIKAYSLLKPAFTNSVHRGDGGIEVKADVAQYDIRGNTCGEMDGDSKAWFGGNMDVHSHATYGEVRYNWVRTRNGGCIDIGISKVNSPIGPVYVTRNTLEGRIRVQNVGSTDGPYEFSANVIVTGRREARAGAFAETVNINEGSRLVLTDNLVQRSAEGFVDEAGLLLGAFRNEYLGRCGHEIVP
jgi:hypothetical protein